MVTLIILYHRYWKLNAKCTEINLKQSEDKSSAYIGGLVKLFLSDCVNIGCVLLLKDYDRVSHLKRPAVHHLRDAEISLSAVPRVRDGLPEVAGDRVSESMLLQVVCQSGPNRLLADHFLEHVNYCGALAKILKILDQYQCDIWYLVTLINMINLFVFCAAGLVYILCYR